MDQPLQVEGLLAGAAPPSAAAEPVSYVDLGAFSQDLLHGILDLHSEHGSVAAIQDGQLRAVFIFSPELNQQVLSDTTRYHARFFAIRGPKNSAQRRLTSGLLSMNGEQHRRNRRLVKEPFGRAAGRDWVDGFSALMFTPMRLRSPRTSVASAFIVPSWPTSSPWS